MHELGLIWRLLDSVREGQFFLTMLRLQFGHTSPEVPERMFSTRIGILARKVREPPQSNPTCRRGTTAILRMRYLCAIETCI